MGWPLEAQLQLAATLVSGRVQLVLVEQQCGSLGGRVVVREEGGHSSPGTNIATAALTYCHCCFNRRTLGLQKAITGLKKTLNQTGSILDQHQANNRTEPDLFCNSWLTLVLDWGLHEGHIGHNTTNQKSDN